MLGFQKLNKILIGQVRFFDYTIIFQKHETVSADCRFTSLRPYVLANLCPCVLMSLRPYVPTPLCPYALMSLRPYVPVPLCPCAFYLRPYVLHPFICALMSGFAGIEPGSTVSVADILSSRPQIGLITTYYTVQQYDAFLKFRT